MQYDNLWKQFQMTTQMTASLAIKPRKSFTDDYPDDNVDNNSNWKNYHPDCDFGCHIVAFCCDLGCH
jgi:hypothetical protein